MVRRNSNNKLPSAIVSINRDPCTMKQSLQWGEEHPPIQSRITIKNNNTRKVI